MKEIIIFGTGEIGQLAYYYFTHDSPYQVAAFTADSEFIQEQTLMGLPVTPFENIIDTYPPEYFDMFVALSYRKMNSIRAEKYNAAKTKGYKLVSYVCSKSVLWDDLAIGDNCLILENQTIQPTVRIGSNVMIWSGNHLGHGSTINDHTYISSHVCISGHVEIGTNCFVGVNAAIKDFVRIGNGVFVSMGALVTKDIEDGAVVLGSRGTILPSDSETATSMKRMYFGM
ncbi:MAG: acetyltransferase [Chloroflexi bacterium]|jgi:sugar O-acyltransferase (sialic acid O-acetyltransferase NeuD family)|nr:acetyltransferase [Chloroflexota bacterium]